MYTITRNMTTVWFLLVLWFVVHGDEDCENMKCLKRKLPLLDNVKAPLMAEIDITSMNIEIEKYINAEIEEKINAVAIEQMKKINADAIEQSKKIEQTLNDLKSTVIQAAATEVTQKLSGFRNSLDNLEMEVEKSDAAVTEVTQKLSGFWNSLDNLEMKVDKTDAKVAVTACVSFSTSYNWPSKVPFKDIQSQTGPIDTKALRNGDFKCPSAGLYIVSFSLVSKTSGARFYIYKNVKSVIDHYISGDDHYDSGTSVVALELNVNDTVSVKPPHSHVYFSASGSCLTVLKIK